eukprot:jgi/Botrbrau1/14959/Bobra.0018s0062.1
MDKDSGAERKRQRTEGVVANPRSEKGVAMHQDQRSVMKMDSRPGSGNTLVVGRMTERQMMTLAIEESKRMAPKEIAPSSDDDHDHEEPDPPKVRKERNLGRSPVRHTARSPATGNQSRTPVAAALKKKRKLGEGEEALQHPSRKKKVARNVPTSPRMRKAQNGAKDIEKHSDDLPRCIRATPSYGQALQLSLGCLQDASGPNLESSLFSSSAREVPVYIEAGALAATADSPPGEGCVEAAETSRGSGVTDSTMLDVEQDPRNRDRAQNSRTTPVSDAESTDSQSQVGEGNCLCIPCGSANADLPADGSSQPSSHDTTCRRDSCSDAEEEASAKRAAAIKSVLWLTEPQRQVPKFRLAVSIFDDDEGCRKPKAVAAMAECTTIPADEVFRETVEMECDGDRVAGSGKKFTDEASRDGSKTAPYINSEQPQTPPMLDRHRTDASPPTPGYLCSRSVPAVPHQTPTWRSLRLRVDGEGSISKEQQRSGKLRTWGKAPAKFPPRRSGRVAALEAEKMADEPLSPTASMVKPETDNNLECRGLAAGVGPCLRASRLVGSHSSEAEARKLHIRAPRTKARRGASVWSSSVETDGHGIGVQDFSMPLRPYRPLPYPERHLSSADLRHLPSPMSPLRRPGPTKPRFPLINACLRHVRRAGKRRSAFQSCVPNGEELPPVPVEAVSPSPQTRGPEQHSTVKAEPLNSNIGPETLGCVLEGFAQGLGREGSALAEQMLSVYRYAWRGFEMAEGRLKTAIPFEVEEQEERRSASPEASEDALGGSPERDEEPGPAPPAIAWGGKPNYKAAKVWGMTLEDTSKLLCTPNYDLQLAQYLALQAAAMEWTLRGRTTRSMPTSCLMPPCKSACFDGREELKELNALVACELASLMSVLDPSFAATCASLLVSSDNVVDKQTVFAMEAQIANAAGVAKCGSLAANVPKEESHI